jgi:hypothetical protein
VGYERALLWIDRSTTLDHSDQTAGLCLSRRVPGAGLTTISSRGCHASLRSAYAVGGLRRQMLAEEQKRWVALAGEERVVVTAASDLGDRVRR